VRTSALDLDVSAMTTADIAAGLELVAAAGWNQTAADWKTMLRLGNGFGVRDEHGRIIATSVVIPYPPRVGWIGMLLVHPAYRQGGIATRLLRHAIDALGRRRLTPMLDAPTGGFACEKLGFAATASLNRWRGRGRGPGATSAPSADQLLEAIARDEAVCGYRREALLLDLASWPDALTLAASEGHLFSRVGRRATEIGPVAARTDAAAISLVGDAIDTIEGEVILHVPASQRALAEMLAGRGFAVDGAFTRMVLGPPADFVTRETLRVTAGPDLG
jgi:GNAT superfamily N-acetyltransferase